jgi:hypothetical protein
MKKQPITSKGLIALSMYLDGQLNEKQSAQLETQLEKDAELRQVFTQLKRTRFLLHQVKPVKVPRNFALKPNMVAGDSRKAAANRWVPVFSYATLVTAVLMVITLLIRYLPMQMKNAAAPEEMAASTPVLEAAEAPSTQADMSSALPIIIWGDASAVTNTYSYGTTGKGGVGGIGGGGGGAEGSGLGGSGITLNPVMPIVSPGVNGFTVIIPSEPKVTDETRAVVTPEVSTAPYKVISSGPILGLRISEQVEQEAVQEPEPVSSETQFDFSTWGLPLGLGIVTLGLGIASLVLWLKKRRT